MSNRWISAYFYPCIRQVEDEIGSKKDEFILKISTEKTVKSCSNRFKLPLIVKDRSKRVTIEEGKTRRIRRDVDDPPELESWDELRVTYPIKTEHRIDEVCRDERFRFIEYLCDVHYKNGALAFSVRNKHMDGHFYPDANTAIGWIEEIIGDVNGDIKSGNEFLESELTRFIEDLKTAIRKDQAERKQRQKTRSELRDEDDGDWDDDRDQGRTPNDDRSDTLNPNNPAYQDAIDNRADQLNPNNPRYQGRR